MGQAIVIYLDGKGYVEKRGGTVFFHDDPRLATVYSDLEDAERGKVGHHRDMGGDGFKGRKISYRSAVSSFKRRRKR